MIRETDRHSTHAQQGSLLRRVVVVEIGPKLEYSILSIEGFGARARALYFKLRRGFGVDLSVVAATAFWSQSSAICHLLLPSSRILPFSATLVLLF
jgi:hypothetical protein